MFLCESCLPFGLSSEGIAIYRSVSVVSRSLAPVAEEMKGKWTIREPISHRSTDQMSLEMSRPGPSVVLEISTA